MLTPESFREKYPPQYRPPKWSFEYDLENSRHSVRLYYQESDNLNNVKKCALQRDVVNIGYENKHFVVDQEGNIGYNNSKSGYTKLWNANTENLPPNLAIYTKTPVSFHPNKLDELPKPLQYRHVINVIGYGFDTTHQPDYQYFSKNGWGKLRHHLTNTMRYVFQCALDLCLPTVVLSYVGGGSFLALFGGDYPSIFVNAVKDALEMSAFQGKGELMGQPTLPDELIQKLKKIAGTRISVLEGTWENAAALVPKVWEGKEAEKKLFVNAWDPHSHAGNGNKGDPSLDGYVGRHSAVSYLCCVDLNPHILENMYALPLPKSGRHGFHE